LPKQLFDFFVKTFDPSDFETLDGAFAAYVRSLSPKWNEVYRSLETAGDDWTQIAFPDVNAIAWRTRPITRGGAEHLPRPARPESGPQFAPRTDLTEPLDKPEPGVNLS
jgi:hypothetical protein